MIKISEDLPRIELFNNNETIVLDFGLKIVRKRNLIIMSSKLIEDKLFYLNPDDYKLRVITRYKDLDDNKIIAKEEEYEIKDFYIEESYIKSKVTEYKLIFII